MITVLGSEAKPVSHDISGLTSHLSIKQLAAVEQNARRSHGHDYNSGPNIDS